MNPRELGSMLAGLGVGVAVSLVLLLCLPLALGFCFFIIGSEQGLVGPTLFVLYIAAMALMPGIGGLVGWLIWRTSPDGPPEPT